MPWENLDFTSIAECYLDVPVMDFLKHECYICEEEFLTTLDPKKRLPDVENAIKGLKVRTTHNDGPRTYRVLKVTELGANKLNFEMEDGNVKTTITVADYFRKCLKYKLKFPELNCLHVGNPKRTIYLPIEVCKIEKGQKRRNTFDTLKCFSPTLSVGSGSFTFNFDDLTSERWNENNFSNAPELKHWAVINYDTNTTKDTVNKFVKHFLEVAREKGMRIHEPLAVFHSLSPSPVSDFNICNERSKGQLQLVMCIICEMNGLYEAIKFADGEVNVTTQCIQSKNVQNCKDSMIIHILIKMKEKMLKCSNEFQPFQ